MKRNLFFSILAAILLVSQAAFAEIKLPAIIASNMVLQRNSQVALWGWANPKEKITLTFSWTDEEVNVKADSEGNWSAKVKTTDSKAPQSIKLKSKESELNLENILFGEVWICSGQSNMQQPLRGYNNQPTFQDPMTIAGSANPNLRLFTVHRKGSKTPTKDLIEYDTWAAASPENVLDFSAVAYFFGEQLQEILDVPVGIIHTSWGGSNVKAWISEEEISPYVEVDLADVDITKRTQHIPTALYNSMIHPLIPFTFKGALWYQGETNRMQPDEYKILFPLMVKDWRTRWGLGDFPFYYVQIAPYWYNDHNVFNTPANSAFIRETQLKCLDLIPNSGMAVTMDIGDEYSIHPPKKKQVADRLLLNALEKTYNIPNVDGQSPVFDKMEIIDSTSTVVLKLKHAEGGLYSFGELTGFEIAGEDKVFFPAEATIKRDKSIAVTSEQVEHPVAVRYAWKNWIEGSLFDTNLLPASSFRTDEWEEATRAE